MKKQLLKRFYPIIMMMFSIVTANAQIVYKDVNPDIVLSCDFFSACSGDYSLDVNNDSINDFTFSQRKQNINCSCKSSGRGRGMGPYSLGTKIDSSVIISTFHSWIADTKGGFALNSLIDSTLGWTNNVHMLAKLSSTCQPCTNGGAELVTMPPSGNWNYTYGKYLALKTQVGTNFYYGWVKLGVSLSQLFTSKITILEFAYNSIPNQPIFAGEKPATGTTQNFTSSSLVLYPNPSKNHLTIALGSNNQKVQITIADITGKVIFSTIATETQKVEVNTKDFTEGIYIVQIQSANFIGTKKLVVKK